MASPNDPDFEPLSNSPPKPFEVDNTRWEMLQSMFLSGVGKDNSKVIAKLISKKDRRISTVAREKLQRLWTSISEFKHIFNGQDQSIMQECHYKEALCEILTQQADQTACWKLILTENINPFNGKLIITCWAAYGIQGRECKFFTERADKLSAELREKFKQDNGYLSENESSDDSDKSDDEGKSEGKKGENDREGEGEGENGDGFSENDDDDFVSRLKGSKCNVQAPLSSSPKPASDANQNVMVQETDNRPSFEARIETVLNNHFENQPEQNKTPTDQSDNASPNQLWSESAEGQCWIPTLTEIPPTADSPNSENSGNQPSPSNLETSNVGRIIEPWQMTTQFVSSRFNNSWEQAEWLRKHPELDTSQFNPGRPWHNPKQPNDPQNEIRFVEFMRFNPSGRVVHREGDNRKSMSVKKSHREGKSASKQHTKKNRYEQRQQRDRAGCNKHYQQNLVRTREAEVKAAKNWGRYTARGQQGAKGAPKRQQRFTPPVPKRGRSNEANKMREMSNQFQQCLTMMTSQLDGFRAQVQDLNHSFQPRTRHIREYDLPDDLPAPINTRPKKYTHRYINRGYQK